MSEHRPQETDRPLDHERLRELQSETQQIDGVRDVKVGTDAAGTPLALYVTLADNVVTTTRLGSVLDDADALEHGYVYRRPTGALRVQLTITEPVQNSGGPS